MSTQKPSKLLTAVEEALSKNEERRAELSDQQKEANAEKAQLQKAHRALTGQPQQDKSDRINATLKHVGKAITIAFGSQPRMQAQELETRVLQVLRAHDRFSERGLKRRVEQGLNRLEKDSAGLLLRPESNPPLATDGNSSSPPAA